MPRLKRTVTAKNEAEKKNILEPFASTDVDSERLIGFGLALADTDSKGLLGFVDFVVNLTSHEKSNKRGRNENFLTIEA